MNDKKKLLVYPYDLYSAPYLRHEDLLKDYVIKKVVSPQGWGIAGRDASCEDRGAPLGIKVEVDFIKCMETIDTVWFVESERQLDFKTHVYPAVRAAAKANKNIILTRAVPENLKEDMKALGKSYSASTKKLTFDTANEKIIRLNTPVIFVLGMGQRMQKFELQLALRDKIIKFGYKVSQVGSRTACELWGFHSFPSELYKNNLTESQKVIFFNRFMKHIESNEKPDVIIIGIPGGIMPYNDQFTNNFGFISYIVANAVEPDTAVLSINYEDWNSDLLEKLALTVEYKLGIHIECFNLSNVQIDYAESTEKNRLQYNTLEKDTAEKKKKKLSAFKLPVFNILNNDDANAMADLLINKLAEYGEYQVV